MQSNSTGLVLWDQIASYGGPALPVMDVSAYQHVRVELQILSASGGAVNNVAVLLSDAAMGDPAAGYGTGVPTLYSKTSLAAPFIVFCIGPGIGAGLLGNGTTNPMGLPVRMEFLRVTISQADNTSAFTARVRVVGFF